MVHEIVDRSITIEAAIIDPFGDLLDLGLSDTTPVVGDILELSSRVRNTGGAGTIYITHLIGFYAEHQGEEALFFWPGEQVEHSAHRVAGAEWLERSNITITEGHLAAQEEGHNILAIAISAGSDLFA